MKWIALLLALAIASAGGYFLFFAPSAAERQLQSVLDDMQRSVATKDRAKIAEALEALLADDAKITLVISFPSFGNGASKSVVQPFDKTGFIQFIDNILYSMNDYGFTAKTHGSKARAMLVKGEAWSDGLSYNGGIGIPMRFTTDDQCEMYITGTLPLHIHQMDCQVMLHLAPHAK